MLPAKRRLEVPVPDRPLSAFALDYRGSSGSAGGGGIIEDVEMPDAGPSTAPLLQQGAPTFFHDE